MENVDTTLKNVLTPFKLPLARDVYQGEEKKYIVYNYSTVPMDFGDDEPERERYLIQVHIYATLKENINALVRAMKKALFAADFSFPESIPASTANEQHIVLETEAVVEIPYGEL